VQENPVVTFFLALAIIIVTARFFGSMARRIGQPRVLGELVAGVVLGATLLDMPHWALFEGIHLQELMHPFAELGVVFLMFIIGLEVDLGELLKVGRVAILAGVLGALLPVALTLPVGVMFDLDTGVTIFAGVALAATSVSISAQVLLELGFLRSKEGNALLATALIDDVLAILLVSVALAVLGGAGGAESDNSAILLILVRMVVYLVVAFAIAWWILPRLLLYWANHPIISQSNGAAALAIVTTLLFAWSAEALGGVAMITGAFIAGVGFSRVRNFATRTIEETVSHVTYAFFLPIFFISVGLEVDLTTLPISAIPLALALLLVAVVSKVGGAGLGALLGGFSRGESLRVGTCMISRGEVGLIIASLGLSAGILEQDSPLFSSLFLVILLTTVVTPILVRWLFARAYPSSDENIPFQHIGHDATHDNHDLAKGHSA
jgi:Kef-type K+ transport system membrane component KefB